MPSSHLQDLGTPPLKSIQKALWSRCLDHLSWLLTMQGSQGSNLNSLLSKPLTLFWRVSVDTLEESHSSSLYSQSHSFSHYPWVYSRRGLDHTSIGKLRALRIVTADAAPITHHPAVTWARRRDTWTPSPGPTTQSPPRRDNPPFFQYCGLRCGGALPHLTLSCKPPLCISTHTAW